MDDTLNLAYSIHHNPGVYALLLGSGVSQSVNIPTGWELRNRIIKDLEDLGEQEIPENIGLDELLKSVAKTPSERNSIVRKHIEPTDADRGNGEKIPSSAHKAIAQLMKAGAVRLVLTTNFDRLLESALEEINVPFNVISSEAMIHSAVPIQHAQATIIKLHGDYRGDAGL